MINGQLAALIEVGSGFHQELTGRENVYLSGSILGMRRNEITRKLDSIIEFSVSASSSILLSNVTLRNVRATRFFDSCSPRS